VPAEWVGQAPEASTEGTAGSHRRSALALLAVTSAVGSMGLAAGGTAGALLAEDMTGSTAAAGVPLGVLVAGSALGALAISRTADRAGRAPGLILGYAVGAAGAVVVILAAVSPSFALLLAGSAVLGAANAAIFLTRYAAADLGGDDSRGRALGTVFVATAVGAVISPNLLGPSGELAQRIGLPSLTGLYLVAIPSFLAAALLLAALPRRWRADPTSQPVAATRQNLGAGLGSRTARVAVLLLGAVNLVMVAVMAIAPIHLVEHGHSFDFVGVVVGIHVLAMFAPSPLTGWLADRAGTAAVAALGAALLAAAGVTGALVDQGSGAAIALVLALLGLGWNAGVVGASTMLAASVPAALRLRSEGIGEIAMGLGAAAGAPAAGLIVALGDFTALSLAGAVGGAAALAMLRLERKTA
jgi:MFS family permease